jgi:predicted PurR-regulated permease PerM
MTRQQVFSIVFFSLLILLLYQIGLMFKPFLFSALWAGLLAHWAFPVHLRLTKLFGGKEALSAVLLTIGALGGVVVPLIVIGVMLVREAGAAEQEIRAWISSGGLQRLPEQVAAIPFIGERLKSVMSGAGTPALSLEQSLMTGVKELSHVLVGGMGGLLKNTFAP